MAHMVHSAIAFEQKESMKSLICLIDATLKP